MKTELLLIGGGGHCHSCIEVIESTGQFQIKGIVGLTLEVGDSVLGYEVLGSDDNLHELIRGCPHAIVAIGQIKSASLRVKAFEHLESLGAKLPTIIASSAVVSRHAKIGRGTIVMHGAIINAGSVVGINGIVNTHALVEHDAQVGDHCHISTSAVLNGRAKVGDKSFVGSGAVVHQCIRIGEQAIIGAGAIVDCDIGDHSIVHTRSHGTGMKINR